MQMNIYLLRDPNDLIVKYVGITKHPVSHRLMTHIKDAKTKQRKQLFLSNKEKWIVELLSEKKRPCIECILKDVDENTAILVERNLIELFKREYEGGSLKNVQVGGFYESCKATPWNKGLTKCYTNQFIQLMKLHQPNNKRIFRFNKAGVLLDTWPSIRTMCSELNLDRRTVRRCLMKKENYVSHKKFMFSYDENDIPCYINKSSLLKKEQSPHAKKVKGTNGNICITFNTVIDAANYMKVTPSSISGALTKSYKIHGYTWDYIQS
nr:MAG TPA: intron associated endonuclease [Caudoviricetes sp.]